MVKNLRSILTFECEDSLCFGTLDSGDRATGLLIVSGGNEIRAGAHRGMASLAARVAQSGYPVFRFDRRGVGDSEGDNHRFDSAASDIAAAVAAFRKATPNVGTIIGFGNCDAATALVLHGGGAFAGLVLANPWIVEAQDDLPPAAAIRARYRKRILSPAAWRDLLGGRIDLAKLYRGVRRASTSATGSTLAGRFAAAMTAAPPATILCAEGDATAIAFRAAWRGLPAPILVPTSSHSFAEAGDDDRLAKLIIAALDAA